MALASVGSVLLLADGVAAKRRHCRKDCKQEITDCLALVPSNKDCTGTRAEKRVCGGRTQRSGRLAATS